MRKAKFSFVLIFFLVFISAFLGVGRFSKTPKPIKAQEGGPYCQYGVSGNTRTAAIGVPRIIPSGSVILPSGYSYVRGYIYDGYSWQPATKVDAVPYGDNPGDRVVYMSITKTYTRDDDLCITDYLVYRRPNGTYGNLQCTKDYMRVFYLESGDQRGYGVKRLNEGQVESFTVTGSHPYIGAVESYDNPYISSKWSGDNKGSTPLPDPVDGYEGWLLSGEGFVSHAGYGRSGSWTGFLTVRFQKDYDSGNPRNLVSNYDLTLQSATFGDGGGEGAYGDYDLSDLRIYSRDNPGNSCTFPNPPVPSCPPVISVETGTATTSLSNSWKSVRFVSPVTGYVEKASVKVGNYGGASRKVSCRVVDSSGNQISSVRKSKFFRGPGADWREIKFSKKFLVEEGKTYYLQCKGPDSWDSLYWVWDGTKGIDEGKNFKVSFSCDQ